MNYSLTRFPIFVCSPFLFFLIYSFLPTCLFSFSPLYLSFPFLSFPSLFLSFSSSRFNLPYFPFSSLPLFPSSYFLLCFSLESVVVTSRVLTAFTATPYSMGEGGLSRMSRNLMGHFSIRQSFRPAVGRWRGRYGGFKIILGWTYACVGHRPYNCFPHRLFRLQRVDPPHF